MTVIERLYDNSWYVAHASPQARAELAADVTRTWMDREAALEDAARARTVANVSPARSALALSMGNASQAQHDRAKARAAEAARCTDIVAGHAFCVRRETGGGGSMRVEVSSCTLLRRAVLSVEGKGQTWCATFHDPQAAYRDTFSTVLGTDGWEALHTACEWITTGRL
ncbi:hypothetical protein [Pedococcus sp. 5OH_020]|uniref:hypothetical protein n=1 Tax=Pedococcus sp. 5OH_020 TaxID=2989814 RepID=UPI0022E9A80A|nr:hypothetical protein [Pedococcus sp. 5OH_020]